MNRSEEATSYKAFDSIFPLMLLPIEGGWTLDKFRKRFSHTQSEVLEPHEKHEDDADQSLWTDAVNVARRK